MKEHKDLVIAWLRYNDMKPTEKAIERIMKRLDKETLERMLKERGVV